MHIPRVTRLVAAAAAVGLAASACGLSSSNSSSSGDVKAGSIDSKALDGQSYTVGSKEFTESILLGKITADALNAAGAKVTDKTNIQGTTNTRKALTSGQIDMYWEYTGTGWITILGKTQPIPDSTKQYQAVKKLDEQKNSITWLKPAPFNNTYAIAVAQETAKKLGVSTLSDYAALAKKDPSKASICVNSEFSNRDDGLPGMEKAYGFTLPKQDVKLVETNVVYTQVDKGSTCTFGEVFDTDGRIQHLGLTTLKDDKHFFPIYEPAITMKTKTYDENKKIADVMDPIAAKLSTATMRKLNARVDVQGEDADAVAKSWLKQQGFIK